ncbi:MAG TPA: UDP-N-acetylmuramoyl-tripeptide--D-alanyl-D-alanine ligase [Terriglobales bacterium]|nr:UDP-N-acetylmuramoyl-tripeptide--D-alanyl-D-alanine ligase [Terriglobales bacterium]
MKLPLSRIAQFLGAAQSIHAAGDRIATGYSIDSRTIQSGELFFAVKGEKMDGHDFVAQAIEKGAIAAVVSREKPFAAELPVIAVDDTLVALQTLATCVRRLWGKPLVGITGSAGKTTTKEAIAHVLATRLKVHKSEGNFNNHFGLPLMLLKVQPEHDVAVIEMGMSHSGEITALAKIAQPEVGVVTNVAPVHLEFFDSLAGIARAKYELIESLPATGTAVLNADDEYVSQFGRDFRGKVMQYGLSPTAAIRAENIEPRAENGSAFDVVVGDQRERASLPLVGSHNVLNALAAVAVALDHGFTLHDAVSALSSISAADKRGQVVRLGNITVINDCYNSNPKALAAMVDALAAMPGKRRIVVAGEMLELGPAGAEMHRESGRHIAEKGIDLLIGVRGLAEQIVAGASVGNIKAEFVPTPEAAGEWLAKNTRDSDVVLLKASRGVKLEKALEVWKEVVGRRSSVVG